MLRLTSLGAAELLRDDGSRISISGRQSKRLALLAYLALARPRGAHRRDTLMTLLWPDLDQAGARAALRQALHGIRKALCAEVVRSDGTESIEIDRRFIECDVWSIEQLAERADHERVIEMYHGDVLQGLYVHDAPTFEHWIESERNRIRELVQKSAWHIATRVCDTDGSAECVRAVRRAVAAAPFDESALRRGMMLLSAAGERAAAVALFREFSNALARELDAKPSPETNAVFKSLHELREVRNAPQPVVEGPVDQLLPSPRAVVELEIVAPRSANPDRASNVVSSGSATRVVAVPRKRWRIAAAVVASAVALGAAAQLSPTYRHPVDARRVRVDHFANIGDIASLNAVTLAVEAAIRDSLSTVESVELDATNCSASTAEEVCANSSNAVRAGTVVRGTLQRLNDSIVVRAQVVSVASNEVVRNERVAFGVNEHDQITGVNAVADVVAAGVASSVYPGWGRAIGQPPSLAAYSSFVAGLNDIQRERHDLAAHKLRDAFTLDSTFFIGGLVAAIEFYQLGQFYTADTLARRIAASSRMLAPVDQQLLQWITSSLRGDRVSARAAMSSVTQLAPSVELAWLQLAIDNVETDRPREALNALAHIDGGNAKGWLSYWATRLEALHLLHEHSTELRVAREALAAHPEMRVLAGYELRALAALGKTDEIAQRLAVGPSVLATDTDDGASAYRQVALDVAAHGYKFESDQLLRALLAWYEAKPDSARANTRVRLGTARTLFLLGDNMRAFVLYDSLMSKRADCVDCIGVRGVLAARLGNIASAQSASDALARIDAPFLFARNLLWRARIAGASGDAAGASRLLTLAFAAGSEFDIMTHADPDLAHVATDRLYREYSFASDAR